MESKIEHIYIAGPMRGYPLYNFPAFDEARNVINSFNDSLAISPADIDRENGFDPDSDIEFTAAMAKDAISRDIDILLHRADAIAVLPGWEGSKGATVEVALAEFLGLRVYRFNPDMTKFGPVIGSLLTEKKKDPRKEVNLECVLDEAKRLQGGDRQNSYGPPDQDFKRTAKMWEAILGAYAKDGELNIPPAAVSLCMIALKLSRETHQHKRDNWVDIAGYAKCGHICRECEDKE